MKRFRKIYVEITNICNKHCSFCPETKRAKAFMSVEDFEFVASKIYKYTDYIYLHVKGEPLMHPSLEKIIQTCNKYGLIPNISTNGVLLGKSVDTLISCKVPKINVSLHSFEKEGNEKLKDYIIDVVKACEKLERNGCIIRFKLWNDTDFNKESNEEIIKELEQSYNTKINSKQYDKDIKLKDRVYLSIKKPFKWPSIKESEICESKCYGLINQIAILVDGTVVPCCLDNDGDINLGNIFNEDLEDILKKERTIKIINGFKEEKCIEELCKKCTFRACL